MIQVAQALERALGVWSASSRGDVEEFLCQAATELLHEAAPHVTGLAIVTCGSERRGVVAKPRGVNVLPDATLRGLLAETITSGGGCKVRDHALDTVRFIDAHFRTSIVVVESVPAALGVGSQLAVWGGLVGGATPKLISQIRALAEGLSRWLDSARVTLLSVLELRRRNYEYHLRLGEMTSVAHDVRAPLASLSYLLSDVERAHPIVVEDVQKIKAEIAYINTLMEGFSPTSHSALARENAVCDMISTLRRVCDRFTKQAINAGISFVWDVPYEEADVRIDPQSLERALTNIVGNAIKHSGAPEVKFEVVEQGGALLARVIDRGVGIPRAVLDRVSLATPSSDLAVESIRAAAGWGVGLLSTKSLVERCGGQLRVRSCAGETCVEMELVRVRNPSSVKESSRVAAVSSPLPLYGEVRVVLVDDDVQHAESLARVLSRAGLSTRDFDSVDAALEYLKEDARAKIVCDARMPDGGAERLLRALRHTGCVQSVAVMSGEIDDEILYRFAALGASEFFAKPVDSDRLVGWARSSREEGAAIAGGEKTSLHGPSGGSLLQTSTCSMGSGNSIWK